MAKPIGLHIALDNRGVVQRANSIIGGDLVTRKPWALIPDGDLWATFEASLAMRGPNSLAISWTKGHATWKHIVGNRSNAEAVGNGQADLAADGATAAAEWQSEQQALHYHARKLKAYQALVTRLQSHAGSLLAKVKELSEEAGVQHRGKYAPPIAVEAPPPIERTCYTEGEYLGLPPLPPALEGKLACVHLFLSCTKWKLEEHSKPTTWLEIYAVFRLMGGALTTPILSPPLSLTRS